MQVIKVQNKVLILKGKFKNQIGYVRRVTRFNFATVIIGVTKTIVHVQDLKVIKENYFLP